MKPTCGRIVIYIVADSDPPEIKHNNADKLPAVVTAVWNGNCVNLHVFCDGPQSGWKTSVLHGTQPGQWCWPNELVPPEAR